MINIEKIKINKSIRDLLSFSIINIDKPSGPTSFAVSHLIKNLLKINKTSHFGTLDPAVSGVLPIGLGRACRLSDYFMHRDKTYVGIMRLHAKVDEKFLTDVIKKFIGKITQLPPLRSRVKRAERIREVKSFSIIESEGKDILFETKVQAGTYIRKLIHDLGEQLGVGAHMLELRRIKAGIFDETTSNKLYELEKAISAWKEGDEKPFRSLLIPAEIISTVLPIVNIKKQVVKKCLSGSPLFLDFLQDANEVKELQKDERFCVFNGEQFIGCFRYVGSEKIIARPEFVFN